MEMTVFERNDGISHVALGGRFDATAAEEIAQRFAEATAVPHQPAIVDLSQIEFMASRGIGLLFANSKNLKKAGHKLVLLNPQGMVEVVLRTSKMDKVMPIAADMEEAIQIATGGTIGSSAPEPPSSELSRPAETTSATTGAVLKVTIENEISELNGLNGKLAEFLAAHSVPSRAAYAVDLAIEELIVNVIRYAYVDAETHFIDVELAIEEEQLLLQIVDDGREFDPRRGPALNLHSEDRQVGGLGLILVLDLVDTLKYERVAETNRVEVRVHLGEEEGGDVGAVGSGAIG